MHGYRQRRLLRPTRLPFRLDALFRFRGRTIVAYYRRLSAPLRSTAKGFFTIMRRRQFLEGCGYGLTSCWRLAHRDSSRGRQHGLAQAELAADVVIVGGGLGGCAAALAALRAGRTVILTEPTDWIGGQLTSQAVPPDEHPWIEQFGANASYRALRDGIRDYYRRHYPMTAEARAGRHLNPGNGNVSRLCHEPRVALAVLTDMLAPYARVPAIAGAARARADSRRRAGRPRSGGHGS